MSTMTTERIVFVAGQWRNRSRDEWLCDHGVGHPIPGEPHHADGVHGCDGCCEEDET